MGGITTEQWLALAPSLAWPLVALVALLVLRPSVLKLVQGVFELNEAVSKASELRALAKGIDDAKNGLARLSPTCEEHRGCDSAKVLLQQRLELCRR